MEHIKKAGTCRDGKYFEREAQKKSKRDVFTPEKVSARYIHYLTALKLLSDRINASPEEMVGWVMLRSECGGLNGYRYPNPCTLGTPFSIFGYEEDYLSLMMHCWFLNDDIINFHPRDVRFITGKNLMQRWSDHPGIKSEAFIQTKVAEGELYDLHPMDRTQWHDLRYLASKESTLFLMSQVKKIEAECFFHSVDESGVEASRRGVSGNVIVGSFGFWNEKRWKNMLSSPPKWLEYARIKPVVRREAAFWNPAVIGNCLLAYRLQHWDATNKVLRQLAHAIPSKNQLERIIRENFSEWLSDWQPDLD